MGNFHPLKVVNATTTTPSGLDPQPTRPTTNLNQPLDPEKLKIGHVKLNRFSLKSCRLIDGPAIS